jgi:hypothetical protein
MGGMSSLFRSPSHLCMLSNARFERFRLGIEYLRSPAMAHPDHFDANALLAYAVANGRECELIESGCGSIRELYGLGQTQVGLWKLPSTRLFEDFCVRDVAGRLEHDYVRGTAVDLTRRGGGEGGAEGGEEKTGGGDGGAGGYTVTLADGTEIGATSVVLALGPAGAPVVPAGIAGVPSDRLIPWRLMDERLRRGHASVMVVGGGLTAVQAAQRCLRAGRSVVLCSRRPLVERHFDIHECWFDKRRANGRVSDFYHRPAAERLAALREVRGGGSVPPMYMDDLRGWRRSGRLDIVSGASPELAGREDGGDGGGGGRLRLRLGPSSSSSSDVAVVDCVVLACGIRPDCASNPLIGKIMERFPIDTIGGYPNVSVDLEWTEDLYVVGALASLNVGPDGGNIMGARRAANIVANALECKSWLRREGVGALSNPFHLLTEDGDSSSDDDDE